MRAGRVRAPEGADTDRLVEVPAAGHGLGRRLIAALGERIPGQAAVLERLMIALLAGGHILLDGPAGPAGQALLRALARALGGSFRRIRFAPGLRVADVVGSAAPAGGSGHGARVGPLFANIVLAERICRAAPAVRRALLEAMQEHQVTLGEGTLPLPEPFLVLATRDLRAVRNAGPPAATEIDRFMLALPVGSLEGEAGRIPSGRSRPKDQAVTSGEEIVRARRELFALRLDAPTEEFIVDLVQATREPVRYGLGALEPIVECGASPRATIYLAAAARARAYLHGRTQVLPEDVRTVAADVLRHRVLPASRAGAAQNTADDVVSRLLGAVESS